MSRFHITRENHTARLQLGAGTARLQRVAVTARLQRVAVTARLQLGAGAARLQRAAPEVKSYTDSRLQNFVKNNVIYLL